MFLSHLLVTIASCILLTNSSGVAEPCIKDETSGHCYQIVDTSVTWTQAFSICKSDGGNLLIIESSEEQQFIEVLIRKRHFTASGLWIGSDKVHPEEERTWVNGEKFSYANWAKGEPNNPLVDENCAGIYIDTKTWNDFECSDLNGYICEDTNLCIKDETTGHCYQIVDNETTWTDAFNICKQANGMLVVIESAEEQQFIEHQIQKINFTEHALWIGSDTLHPEARRKWANGKKFQYVNWTEGQPDNSPYVENCAEIYTNDGKWNNYKCSYWRGYICENTITKSSDGAEPCIKDETSGHCYQNADTPVTWTQAFNICRQNGGSLVIIESAMEQQFISSQIQKRNFTADALWIGSDKVHPEEQRAWLNGENFSYVNWDEGEPDYPHVDENCAEILTNSRTWNDESCTYWKGYICENTRNWTRYGKEPYIKYVNTGNYYKIVNTLATWTQASDICRQDGGMLLIIDSAEEQQFIEEQMQNINFTVNALWMGSDKLHPEKQRKWSNGNKFTYVNWADGEPNNTPYVENCAEIYTFNNKWMSNLCTDLRGYICEKTPPGKPSTSQPRVFVIGVAVGSALVLLVGILLLYCFIHKRKKHKRDETYEGHETRMNSIENVYNQPVDPNDTYCTVDD